MISTEESIPIKNDNYRAGEDIFYTQFNDVFFYVEDEDQENLYFCILKKIFSDIKLEKIFPLCGKKNVVDEAKNNLDDKKKVYIVDKDFDDILNIKENLANLFYLERYSIENYLFEKGAILEYIISENPRLSKIRVDQALDLSSIINNISSSLNHLTYLYLIIQTNCRREPSISIGCNRFIDFDNINQTFAPKILELDIYETEVENALKNIDSRFSINGRLKKARQMVSLRNNTDCLTHIPGKFILEMLKKIVISKFSLSTIKTHSFVYRLAKECKFESLNYLEISIRNYIT